MKETSKDGRVWFEKKGAEVSIGFTPQLLGELEDCWHILAGATSKTEIKEGQPLCSVETNDGLFSVPTPVSGIITFFDNKAMNFPQKLTTEDVVCVVKDAEEVRKQKMVQDDALREALAAHAAAVEARMAADAQRAQAQQPAAGGNRIRLGDMPPGWGVAHAEAPVQPVRARELFNDFFERPREVVQPNEVRRPANPRRRG